MKFLFILLFVIHCFTKVTFSKPVPPSSENIADADYTMSSDNSDMNFLNTRAIDDYYGTDAPNYVTSSNPITSWIYSIANGLSSYPNQIFQSTQYPFYGNTFSSTNSPYNQEQSDNSLTHYDWNQSQLQPDTQSFGSTYGNTYGTGYVQPHVTKKVSTIFSDDSREIKHKLILSPDHPDGTGYISIKKPAKMNQTNSSSKEGSTVFYRF